MKIKVLNEEGIDEALLGIGLSYGITSDKTIKDVREDSVLKKRLSKIASKLIRKGGSHTKFLESICIWLDLDEIGRAHV